jgi:TolB-like protein/Tfp pilus assembly protein PilF
MQQDPLARFGRFEVCRRTRVLRADGRPVELGCRAVDILFALIDAAGDVVSKSDLMERVWPGLAVAENNLQVQICSLRRALGRDRDLIRTVPGRGYHFAGELRTSDPASATAARPLSIVVLPLLNLGGDTACDYLVSGTTESLTTDISRALPGSFVVSRAAANTYRGNVVDIRAVGRELGVRYVLEGSIQFDGSKIRVNARLSDTINNRLLWAERFDACRDDMLAAQDRIVARLSRSVGLRIIDTEAGQRRRATRPQALDLVMRGRAAMNRPSTRQTLVEARALFEQALSIDPGNIDALAEIATILVFEVLNGYYDAGRAERLARSDALLGEALAGDPNHIPALRARAALLRARGLFQEAIAAAEAAIACNPGEPRAYNEIGLSWLYLGEVERAIAWFGKAAEVGPRDPARWVWLSGLGRTQLFLKQDAEAVRSLSAAVAANPKDFFSHAFLAAACALAGRLAEAEAALQTCMKLRPGLTIETLCRTWSVPLAATAAAYMQGHRRLLHGLEKAGMPRREYA